MNIEYYADKLRKLIKFIDLYNDLKPELLRCAPFHDTIFNSDKFDDYVKKLEKEAQRALVDDFSSQLKKMSLQELSDLVEDTLNKGL